MRIYAMKENSDGTTLRLSRIAILLLTFCSLRIETNQKLIVSSCLRTDKSGILPIYNMTVSCRNLLSTRSSHLSSRRLRIVMFLLGVIFASIEIRSQTRYIQAYFKTSNTFFSNAVATSSSQTQHGDSQLYPLQNDTKNIKHNQTTAVIRATHNMVHNHSGYTSLLVNGRSGNPSLVSYKEGYTLAQQCRIELEQWLNPIIDELLLMGEAMPPLIDWVWDMGSHFIINLMFRNVYQWSNAAFLGATWNWQDQFGNNFTIDGIIGKTHRKPVKLPYLNVPSLNVTNQTERSIPVFLWASNIKVPDNKTVRHWVYDLRPFLKCDRIESQIEKPLPGTKIGMCVRFRGDHHLLPPFIAYHRLIGVDHFWFFHNEEFNITDLPLAPDVTYIPYRFVWTEHKNYSRMKDEKSGEIKPWRLAYNGRDFWQVSAMQQCLYRLKRYGLDWLMANDIDEYLWVNKTESTGAKLHNISVLQDFLQAYEAMPSLGGLAVEGWSFGTNGTSQENELELHIDYIHRTRQIAGGRRKIIYRVPNAKRIHIHWLYEGGSLISLPPSDIRWNHYRRPNQGIFQRGRREVVQDASLPDTYRTSILESMKQDTYMIPKTA